MIRPVKHVSGTLCGLLAAMLLSPPGWAEEYRFEIGAGYANTSFEGSQTITTPGGTVFNSGKTDTDDLGVRGNWYFYGLSDDSGPRARAAFVDRASSLSFGYSRSDQTTRTLITSDDPTFPFPPQDLTFDLDVDAYVLDMRYVHRDSGWFGDAGLVLTDTSFSLGGSVNDSGDATGWRLGIGKYIFSNTAVSVEVSQVDADGGADAEAYAAAFAHLGDLGEKWQYAVDLAYSRSESDFDLDLDTWSGAFSLYPTRDFEFGIAVEDVSGDRFAGDTTGFAGFVSWFVTSNVSLSASYRTDDVDYLGNVSIGGGTIDADADQDMFALGVSVRF
jgi:hypothetical protein